MPPRRRYQRYLAPGILLFYLGCELYLLSQARHFGLLPYPQAGTDQKTMLEAALALGLHGELPATGYLYSPIYTAFLALAARLTGGNLVAMRIFQAAFAALAPVLIYKIARNLRFSFEAALLGALLFCFYGAALLIGLDFLRAAPLGVLVLATVYSLIRSFRRQSLPGYFLTGALAGLAVLGRETNLLLPVAALPLLCFPEIRRRVLNFRVPGMLLAGLGAALLPVLLFNLYREGVLAVVPGHTVNVLEAYHGSAAVADRAVAWRSIMANLPRQFANFFSNYEIPNSLSLYAHAELLPFLRIFAVPANLLLALALPAGVLFRRNRGVWLLLGVIAVYSFSLLFFTVFYRFRVPVMGVAAVLAGGTLAWLIDALRQRRFGGAAAVLSAVLLFCLVTYSSPRRLRPAGERRSAAILLVLQDRLDEAEALTRELAEDRIPCRDLQQEIARRRSVAENRGVGGK